MGWFFANAGWLAYAALGVGAVLVVFAWRGRRVDRVARCRKCSYALVGLAAAVEGKGAVACPECGRGIARRRDWRLGLRKKRWVVLFVGVVLILPAVGRYVLASTAGPVAGRPAWRLVVDLSVSGTMGRSERRALVEEFATRWDEGRLPGYAKARLRKTIVDAWERGHYDPLLTTVDFVLRLQLDQPFSAEETERITTGAAGMCVDDGVSGNGRAAQAVLAIFMPGARGVVEVMLDGDRQQRAVAVGLLRELELAEDEDLRYRLIASSLGALDLPTRRKVMDNGVFVGFLIHDARARGSDDERLRSMLVNGVETGGPRRQSVSVSLLRWLTPQDPDEWLLRKVLGYVTSSGRFHHFRDDGFGEINTGWRSAGLTGSGGTYLLRHVEAVEPVLIEALGDGGDRAGVLMAAHLLIVGGRVEAGGGIDVLFRAIEPSLRRNRLRDDCSVAISSLIYLGVSVVPAIDEAIRVDRDDEQRLEALRFARSEIMAPSPDLKTFMARWRESPLSLRVDPPWRPEDHPSGLGRVPGAVVGDREGASGSGVD